MRQVKKAIAIPAPPRIADDSAIEQLGADLRNDLNNPLQEIVAMTFVARSESRTPAGAISPKTTQALEAIDRAAKNLATLVRGLEERIRTVVQSDEQVPAGGAWTADRQTR